MRPSLFRLVLIVLAFILSFLLVFSKIFPQVITLRAAATAAQIIIDPENPTATEVTVNEGNSIQLRPQVRDTAGNVIEGLPLAYNSISSDIATVDAVGKVQGKKAGFSTLTVSSGAVVATATITVASITSGTVGFNITGLTQDPGGRLYLADTQDHTILLAEELRKSPSIYAGTNQVSGLINDERLKSLFNRPAFLALNQNDGSLYVTDSANNAIRRVRPGPTGKVETLTLNQALNNPQGAALDNRGNLWVSDSGSHTVKRVDLTTGAVSTIAGEPGNPGLADGMGSQARFNSPVGLAIETEAFVQELERQGTGAPPPPVTVIVADTGNGLIRRVREDGRVETIGAASTAKSETSPYSSQHSSSVTPPLFLFPDPRLTATPPLSLSTSPPLSAASVRFDAPTGVATDPLGNIYVSETGSRRVKTILQKGIVVPAAQENTFVNPRGIVISSKGQVAVADSSSSARLITYGEPTISSTTPGQISNRGGGKVTVKGQNFAPDTLVVLAGVVPGVQVVDTQTIAFTAPALPSGRKTLTIQNRGGLAQTSFQVDPGPLSDLPAGYITTVAGGSDFVGDGSLAVSASLVYPEALAFDSAGKLYIADTEHNRIRRVDGRTGIITTVTGTGKLGFSGDNSLATTAALFFPHGLAFDSAGNLYIADTQNFRIRRLDGRTGIITTVAGTGQFGFSGDNGPATAAALDRPYGLAFDSGENLYIAERDNHRIRRVDGRTGIITTVAGTGQGSATGGFSGDNGPATAAALNSPEGLAFDSAGNLYIADGGNSRIRKVDGRTGIITTVAGGGYSGDNGPATAAALGFPGALAFDLAGNLYIAANDRIRKVDARTGIITTVAGSGQGGAFGGFSGDNGPATAAALAAPAGLAFDSAGNLYCG